MAIPIPKKTGFQEFPKWMRHPAEREAVVCNEEEVDPVTGRRYWVHKPPGQPVKFPPCMAIDADQEAYFRAQGYVAADGDPAAYHRATIAPVPDGYVHREYPLMLADGTIDLGPDAPPAPTNFYPYYVRMPGYEPTLVENVEEHQTVLRDRGVEPEPEPSEEDEIAELERRLAELQAKKAERLDPVRQPEGFQSEAAPAEPADPTAASEAPGPVDDQPSDGETQAPAAEELLEVEEQTAAVEDVKTEAENEVTARLAEIEAEQAPAAQKTGGKRR